MEELIKQGKIFAIAYNSQTNRYIVFSQELGIREQFASKKRCKQWFDMMEEKYGYY